MLKLLGAIGGWQGYAAAAVLAALLAASATFYVTSLGYRLTMAGMEKQMATDDAKNAIASLEQFKTDAGLIHDAAKAYSSQQSDLTAKMDVISRDFHNAIKNRPLPLDCVPDDIRLRSLSQAIAAANNTAAGRNPIPAVSPTH